MGGMTGRILGVFLSIVAWSPAVAQVQPDRPVILVPGILGSRLCDATGKVVWGTAKSFLNFQELELREDGDARGIRSCGLIEEFQIMGSFWATDQYNSLMTSLSKLGYLSEQRNLYVFDYDWRISNYETARLLDEFIKQNLPAGRPFDIVAHSMGGIVSRIYMDKYVSSKALQRIVYLGTPFLGSMNTFGVIKEGWGWPLTKMAGGQDVVWRVALSFPSMIELLPRYEECCYVRRADGSRQFLDIFDAHIWRNLGWLPSAYSEPEAFAHFETTLRRSKALTDLLLRPAPSGIWEFIFASDAHDTLRRVGMRESATKPGDWVFSKARGDGTVPVWSVARSPQSDAYSNTLPSHETHAHLFRDRWVINKLERSLLSIRPNDPDPIKAPGRPALSVILNGVPSTWSIDIVDVELPRPFVRPSEHIQANLTIQFESGVRDVTANVYKPQAFIEQFGRRYQLDVQDISNNRDIGVGELRFRASGIAPEHEGGAEIVFQVNESFSSSRGIYLTQIAD